MPAQYGTPEVMEFKDGKRAALSLQFDDSMETQADTAIPLMNERGLVGTFFVNPGLERYRNRRDTWEVVCPEHGHELANHTLRHQGAADYDEADHEIGESSRHIWALYPDRSKLLPFLRGGGTTWGSSRERVRTLMDRHFLFRAPRSAGPTDERGTGQDPSVFAREAIDEGKWAQVGFHGVGGQWLSSSAEGFAKLCDFLAEHGDEIWVPTTGDGYKYATARDAVSGDAQRRDREGFQAVCRVRRGQGQHAWRGVRRTLRRAAHRSRERAGGVAAVLNRAGRRRRDAPHRPDRRHTPRALRRAARRRPGGCHATGPGGRQPLIRTGEHR